MRFLNSYSNTKNVKLVYRQFVAAIRENRYDKNIFDSLFPKILGVQFVFYNFQIRIIIIK